MSLDTFFVFSAITTLGVTILLTLCWIGLAVYDHLKNT